MSIAETLSPFTSSCRIHIPAALVRFLPVLWLLPQLSTLCFSLAHPFFSFLLTLEAPYKKKVTRLAKVAIQYSVAFVVVVYKRCNPAARGTYKYYCNTVLELVLMRESESGAVGKRCECRACGAASPGASCAACRVRALLINGKKSGVAELCLSARHHSAQWLLITFSLPSTVVCVASSDFL